MVKSGGILSMPLGTEEEVVRIRFKPKTQGDFATVLKQRVDAYFSERSLSRHANFEVYLKGVLHLVVFFGLYFAILSEEFSKPVMLVMAMIIGMLHGFIGVNISHDALHNAYSPYSKVNKCLGYTFDFVGLSSYVWKVTHNFHHHIYTNVPGVDHDISHTVLLRFSPADKHYWFHRYQQFYTFFFYCITGANWIFYSDHKWFIEEQKKRRIPTHEVIAFYFFKMVNFTMFLIIPMIVMTLPWWQILIGFIALQLAGGFFISVIFQLAHMVEGLEYPEPNSEGVMENQWAAHEMLTTCNFATKNRFLNYVCGGLNFQVEHHLFPYICHIHYKDLSPIVKQTAHEFGLPYNENPTFTQAIISHYRHLKKLGAGYTK
jgi:linoleoyl-CoA desaturase